MGLLQMQTWNKNSKECCLSPDSALSKTELNQKNLMEVYTTVADAARPDATRHRIYDGVEAETRKSQASFQII